jgi:hypothetical protein
MGKQVGVAGSISFGWNENVLALRVQPLKLRGFLSPTDERKRRGLIRFLKLSLTQLATV